MTAIIDAMVGIAEAVLDWRPRFVLRHQFEKVFGFTPSKKGRIRKLEQQAVSDSTAQLHSVFDLLCQEEEKIYASANRYGENPALLAAREKVLELRVKLEAAKHEFWRAHRLARSFGFKVEGHAYVEAHDHLAVTDARQSTLPSWLG